MINVTSSAGNPTVSKTITIVTNPAWGIPTNKPAVLPLRTFHRPRLPAAPMLAAVAVMLIATKLPKLSDTPRIWAMKMAATASYSAVPSMLIVAPIGITKRATRGSIPLRSSRQLMAMGRVAELKRSCAV